MAKPNSAQRGIMEAALGVSGAGARGRPPGFRNNITLICSDPIVKSCVKKGWMVGRNQFPDGMGYFSVTRSGAEAIGLDPSVIRTKEKAESG